MKARLLNFGMLMIAASCSQGQHAQATNQTGAVAMDDNYRSEVEARLRGAAQIAMTLEKAGELLADQRPVTLFFYGSPDALARLNADPLLSSFKSDEMTDPEGKSFSANVVTDDEWIVRTAHDMVSVSHKYGVRYDGWEAGVVRQGAPR